MYLYILCDRVTSILKFKMWVLIIFLLLRYITYLQAGTEIVGNGLLVQHCIAGCMFSFVAQIFHSIDTTKPAILSGAREQESGAMIDTKYLLLKVS